MANWWETKPSKTGNWWEAVSQPAKTPSQQAAADQKSKNLIEPTAAKSGGGSWGGTPAPVVTPPKPIPYPNTTISKPTGNAIPLQQVEAKANEYKKLGLWGLLNPFKVIPEGIKAIGDIGTAISNIGKPKSKVYQDVIDQEDAFQAYKRSQEKEQRFTELSKTSKPVVAPTKTPNDLGELKNSFSQSFYANLSAMGASLEVFGKQLGSQKLREFGESVSDRYAFTVSQHPEWNAPKGVSFDEAGAKVLLDPTYYMRALGNIVPSMVGGLTVTLSTLAITKNPLATATAAFTYSTALETGSAYNNMVDSGIPPDKAYGAAQVYGVIAGSLESITDIRVGGKLLGAAATNQVKQSWLKAALKELAISSSIEGSTESAQQLAQNIITRFLDTSQPVWQGVIDSGIAGAIGGFGAGTITASVDFIRGETPAGEQKMTLDEGIKESKSKSTSAPMTEDELIDKTPEQVLADNKKLNQLISENPDLTMDERVMASVDNHSAAVEQYINENKMTVVDDPMAQIYVLPAGKQFMVGYSLDLGNTMLTGDVAQSELYASPEAATQSVIDTLATRTDLDTGAVDAIKQAISQASQTKPEAAKAASKAAEATPNGEVGKLDNLAKDLFIKRQGQEAYDSAEIGTTLERIEQEAEAYDPVFLKKHPELKDHSITVYHDPIASEDLAVIDNETGKVVEIFDKELKKLFGAKPEATQQTEPTQKPEKSKSVTSAKKTKTTKTVSKSTKAVERYQVVDTQARQDELISSVEATNILRQYFTEQELPVEVVDQITTYDGGEAWAKYLNGIISFVKNPSGSAPTHEAVHAFLNMFITPQKYQAYIARTLAEQTKLIGADKVERAILDLEVSYGGKINRTQARNLYAEEVMADNFVSYVQGQKPKTFLRRIYDKIVSFIRGITDPDSVANLYQDIIDRKRINQEELVRAKEAYFMAQEDRFKATTKTLAKMKNELKSATVSRVAIENYLNRQEITQLDSDILTQTLAGFEGDKIPVAEFIASAESKIMPVALIRSKTYANWGYQKLASLKIGDRGNNELDATFETHIWDTPYKHGQAGHFHADYSQTPINYEIVARTDPETGKNLFVVKVVGAEITEQNIADTVATVEYSQAQAEQWIADHQVAKSDEAKSGLLGHTRIADTINPEKTMRALQETIYQNNELISKERSSESPDQETIDKLSRENERSKENIKSLREANQPVDKTRYLLEIQSDPFQDRYRVNSKYTTAKKTAVALDFVLTNKDQPFPIAQSAKATDVAILVDTLLIEQKNSPIRIAVRKNHGTEGGQEGAFFVFRLVDKDGDEIATNEYGDTTPDTRKIIDEMLAKLVKKNTADIAKLGKARTDLEKQFFGVGNKYHERAIKEEVRLAANDLLEKQGETVKLRVPTPFTVSLIEGAVSSELAVADEGLVDRRTQALTPEEKLRREMAQEIPSSPTPPFAEGEVVIVPNQEVIPSVLDRWETIDVDGDIYEVTGVRENNEMVTLAKNEDLSLLPYEWDSSDDPDVGDTIDYGGTDYEVVESSSDYITVAPADRVRKFDWDDYISDEVDNTMTEAEYEFNSLVTKYGAIDTAEQATKVIEGEKDNFDYWETGKVLEDMSNAGADETGLKFDDYTENARQSAYESASERYSDQREWEGMGYEKVYFKEGSRGDITDIIVVEEGATVDELPTPSNSEIATPVAVISQEDLNKMITAGMEKNGQSTKKYEAELAAWEKKKLEITTKYDKLIEEAKSSKTPTLKLQTDKDGAYLFSANKLTDEAAQTVYRYYEQNVIPFFKKYRPDAKIITDERGIQWWETTVTSADKGEIAAFMKKESAPIPTEVTEEMYARNRQKNKMTWLDKLNKFAKFKKPVDKLAAQVFVPISTRLGDIAPVLRSAIKKYEFQLGIRNMKYAKRILPFIRGIRTMSRGELADLDLALKNRDEGKINELVDKYNLQEPYSDMMTALAELRQEAIEVGYDIGYLETYFPRNIKDPEGLVEYLHGRDDWSIIQEAINEKAIQLGRVLTVPEQAAVANTMIRGFGVGNIMLSEKSAMKKRAIDVIDPELNQFYGDPVSALLNYVNAMTEAVAARKFFGRTGKAKEIDSIDDSIGAYLIKLIVEGTIKPSQEKAVREILQARFGYKPTDPIVAFYKNISYIDTMGSFTSALTQVGDLAFTLYRTGFWQTFKSVTKAIRNKSKVTRADLGIDRIAEEFRIDRSKTSQAVETVFKAVGLERIDRLGKETFIDAIWTKYHQAALKKPQWLIDRLRKVFGDDYLEVLHDLQESVMSENVKLLLFNELSEVQPISMSDMPESYLKSPNGRIFYMLKTFTLKQFDLYRNEVFKVMRKNPLEGIKRMLQLSAALMLMNATADELKNLLLGRPLKWSDLLIDNILRLMGFSKYTVYKSRQEGIGYLISAQVMPPTKFPTAVLKDIQATIKDPSWDTLRKSETAQSIPVIGKLYYWWFGKGHDSSVKVAATANDTRLVQKYVGEYEAGNKTNASKNQLAKQLVEEYVGTKNPKTLEEKTQATRIKTKFTLAIKKGVSIPMAESVMAATTNADKAKELNKLKKKLSENDFKKTLNDLNDNGIISDELLKAYKKGEYE